MDSALNIGTLGDFRQKSPKVICELATYLHFSAVDGVSGRSILTRALGGGPISLFERVAMSKT